MRRLIILGILICLSFPTQKAHALVATGPGATGITGANGWMDEARILAALGQGALGNCFLTSIRFGGVEPCWNGIWPRLCIRVRNNSVSNLMEASGKRQHITLMTVLSETFLTAWAGESWSMPTSKKLGKDHSAYQSSSGRVMSRTLGTPLLMETLQTLISVASLETICKPPSVGLGYIYFAEGDEMNGGVSMWRSIISPYYLNSMTSGISFHAKATETIGLCKYDVNYMLCMGGFGTKYPTAADVGSGSPALRLITGMWRAQEIHSSTMGTFGPYNVSLGPVVHAQLHLPTSMVGGYTAEIPPYSPGSYMQWLYPGVGSLPVGKPDFFCTPLGIGPGSSPQVMAQMLSESLNKTWMDEDSLSFAYWSRWTCCNWCVLSDDHYVRHWIPEAGYAPVLTRIP